MMATMYASVSYEGKDIKELSSFTEQTVKPYLERQDDVASVAYWYQSEPHQAFKPLMNKKERWPR